jgi:hypothetical protein
MPDSQSGSSASAKEITLYIDWSVWRRSSSFMQVLAGGFQLKFRGRRNGVAKLIVCAQADDHAKAAASARVPVRSTVNHNFFLFLD